MLRFSTWTKIVLSFLTVFILASCQDEDFGYTQEDIFKGVYERNFIKAFGEIDPEETWDFSSWGMHNRAPKTSETRADGDTYYYVEKNTMDWIRQYFPEGQSNTGTSFGMLVGQESFEIIPIYQSASSTVDWELHMVLVNGDNYIDKLLWKKSERIQIPQTTTGSCAILMESAEGTQNCVICRGNGYISVSNGGTTCSHCVGGFIEDEHCGPCTQCSGTGIGEGECNKCSGKGYYSSGNGKNATYNACTQCGGEDLTEKIKNLSSSDKLNNLNQFGKLIAKYGWKKGTGEGTCSKCNGSGLAPRLCDYCDGLGQLQTCTGCGGDGLGTVCHLCSGKGQTSETSWVNITSSNDTENASAIRTQPISINTATEFGVSPIGGIIFFYLDKNDGTINQSSLKEKMIFIDCPRPTNIPSDEIKLIGCEEGDVAGSDFNDIMFIIKGKPLPVILESSDLGQTFGTMVAKRYLVEDLSSNSTWDFNDVVVDVTQQINKVLTAGSTNPYKLVDQAGETKARLKHLCGTVPIKVNVGNAETYIIADPTNREQTVDLFDSTVGTKSYTTYKEGTAVGNGWDPNEMISSNLTGWTPSNNSVIVTVWPDFDIAKTGGGGTWEASFPQPGQIPYIIAVDMTKDQNWPDEEVDISTMSWWSSGQTNYYTGK